MPQHPASGEQEWDKEKRARGGGGAVIWTPGESFIPARIINAANIEALYHLFNAPEKLRPS